MSDALGPPMQVTQLLDGRDPLCGLLRIQEKQVAELSALFRDSGSEFQASVQQPLEQVLRDLESPQVSTWNAQESAAARACAAQLRVILDCDVSRAQENYADQSDHARDIGLIVGRALLGIALLSLVLAIAAVSLARAPRFAQAAGLSAVEKVLRNYWDDLMRVVQNKQTGETIGAALRMPGLIGPQRVALEKMNGVLGGVSRWDARVKPTQRRFHELAEKIGAKPSDLPSLAAEADRRGLLDANADAQILEKMLRGLVEHRQGVAKDTILLADNMFSVPPNPERFFKNLRASGS